MITNYCTNEEIKIILRTVVDRLTDGENRINSTDDLYYPQLFDILSTDEFYFNIYADPLTYETTDKKEKEIKKDVVTEIRCIYDVLKELKIDLGYNKYVDDEDEISNDTMIKIADSSNRQSLAMSIWDKYGNHTRIINNSIYFVYLSKHLALVPVVKEVRLNILIRLFCSHSNRNQIEIYQLKESLKNGVL